MPDRRRHSKEPPPDRTPVLGTSAGRRALLVDGVVQSVAADDAATGYWAAMLPDYRPSSALLLGVGGGTVARLLQRVYPDVPITGVDESAEILRLARESFGLEGENLTLVEMDAFVFVSQTEARFDYIAVDLYHGNLLVRGVLGLPFLRRLAARLLPGGQVAYNLFRNAYLEERLGRLERVFDRVRLEEVAANAIFFGRPHRRG